MKKTLFFLAVLWAGWKLYNQPGEVTLGPGVLVPETPIQERGGSFVSHNFVGYSFTGLAKFHIKAKVLSKRNYSDGRAGDLAPTDLALGWGNMSDESVLSQIDISQSGRFFRWSVDSFPISRREIETSSTNIHLIPSNDDIQNTIDKVKHGDIIQMSGNLVNVISDTDGWHWESSLTRNDTGAGACELILIDDFQIITP